MADYNSLVNLYRTATKAEEDEEKRKQNQIYDNQAQVIKDTYDSAIKVSETDYNKLEREAEIQRLINKNEVAEDMANIGHKDSGLSRDQTAAVEIAASNQKAKISLARQQAKEAKILEMKSKLAEIENNRLSADNSISNAYTKLATDNAAKYIEKEQEEAAKNITYTYARTESDSQGNQYVVYRGNDGKEYKTEKGVNPYTGDNNNDYELINGYQPKTVNYGDYDYGSATDTGTTAVESGQKIWTTGAGQYWIWDATVNSYLPYDSSKVKIKPTQTNRTEALVKKIEADFQSYDHKMKESDLNESQKKELRARVANTWIEMTGSYKTFTDGELLYLIEKYQIK